MKLPKYLLCAVFAGASVVCNADNLVMNGDAEDVSKGWGSSIEISAEAAKEGQHGFAVSKSRAWLLSPEFIPVDREKAYKLEISYRSKDDDKCAPAFIGLACFDVNRKPISRESITVVPGSFSILAEAAQKGDTVLKVADASDWKMRHAHSPTVVAFNAKEDLSDLPNRSLSSGITSIARNDAGWEVTLQKPLGRSYPAGTAVRQQISARGYMYGISAGADAPAVWKTKEMKVFGVADGQPEVDRFWPGTEYVKVVIIPNYNPGINSVFYFDNVRFTKITPEEATRPTPVVAGGKNLNAFRLNTEKTMEEVLAENRKLISRNDKRYRFSWDNFLTLINELSDTNRYLVLPARDFMKTEAPDKIMVYMRHDIDCDPETALRMAKAEKEVGMRASYYILNTVPYYGMQTSSGVKRYVCMDELYLEIQGLGHEIGVHNDLMSAMIKWDVDPLVFQKQELDYYRSVGLDVTGVVSHGSGLVLSRKLNNTWMFSELGKSGSFTEDGKRYEYGKYSVRDFGFDYEGYRLTSKRGGSDISEGTFQEAFMDRLKALVPGDRVTLLTHPIHWGDRDADL